MATPVTLSSLGLPQTPAFNGVYWANLTKCQASGNTCGWIIAPFNTTFASADAFRLLSHGCPMGNVTSATPGKVDAWSMDQNRVLTQAQDGM